MKVKNINGRRQSSCRCGTWLDHWSKMSGQPLPDHCSEARCMGKPELGAHVQKDSSVDTSWYIVPLCVKHSIRAEVLEVADTAALVPAQVSETCARQLPLGHVWPREMRAALAANALQHGVAAVQAQDWLDRASLASARLLGLRKDEEKKPAPLRSCY